MKKTTLSLAVLIFFVFVIRLVFQESKKYQHIKEKIYEVVDESKSTTAYSQFYDIMEVAEKTFIDINSPAEEIAQWRAKNERGYVLREGSVITYLDNWMLSLEKRTAEPEEVQDMYIDFFKHVSSGFYFPSIFFYLFKLFIFSIVSFIPFLLSLIIAAAPTVSVNYAATLGVVLLFVIVKDVKAQDQTLFEVDLFNQKGENRYEFLLMNFNEKMTSVLYVPGNSVIAATGPNMTLGNGLFSPLGGVCIGHNGKNLALTDVNLWYIYFGSFFEGKLDYVTFGLYDHPIHSKKWWSWFKHQLNIPVTKKLGLGFREDTTIDARGCHTTYGPVIKLQLNSMSMHIHYRLGEKEKTLLLRAEIPIN